MILKLNEVETQRLLDDGIVVVNRNHQEIIVEKKPYSDGYDISIICKYDDVELYRKD